MTTSDTNQQLSTAVLYAAFADHATIAISIPA
jgi:hypothetical protein